MFFMILLIMDIFFFTLKYLFYDLFTEWFFREPKNALLQNLF